MGIIILDTEDVDMTEGSMDEEDPDVEDDLCWTTTVYSSWLSIQYENYTLKLDRWDDNELEIDFCF